jgi:hypothetical protein
MANPTGNELLTVQGVQANGQPAATTEVFTLNQVGAIPSLFGGGTAVMEESGNVNVQSGAPLTNPASITNDNVLAVYTLPAGSLSAAGKGLEITAGGNFPLTDTQAKRVKLIWNPTTAVVGSAVGTNSTSFLLGDTGSTTNAGAACGWLIQSEVYKYGALGSNTQIAQETGVIIGATHGGCGLAAALTTNESLAIPIAITGNATSSVGDIALYNINIQAFN